jgi:hypothetical protein
MQATNVTATATRREQCTLQRSVRKSFWSAAPACRSAVLSARYTTSSLFCEKPALQVARHLESAMQVADTVDRVTFEMPRKVIRGARLDQCDLRQGIQCRIQIGFVETDVLQFAGEIVGICLHVEVPVSRQIEEDRLADPL